MAKCVYDLKKQRFHSLLESYSNCDLSLVSHSHLVSHSTKMDSRWRSSAVLYWVDYLFHAIPFKTWSHTKLWLPMPNVYACRGEGLTYWYAPSWNDTMWSWKQYANSYDTWTRLDRSDCRPLNSIFRVTPHSKRPYTVVAFVLPLCPLDCDNYFVDILLPDSYMKSA